MALNFTVKTRIFLGVLIYTLTICQSLPLLALDASEALNQIKQKAMELETSGTKVLQGKDGWLFFSGELRSISVGQFWGEAAVKVSRASRAQAMDPLPAILEFNTQCQEAGAELLLVPVPAKAVIYADKLVDGLEKTGEGVLPRVDLHHQAFYKILREHGINVLDMTDLFLRERQGGKELYCRDDTHWSSYACLLTAKAIHAEVAGREWLKNHNPTESDIVSIERPLAIKGDLWGYLTGVDAREEILPMFYVGKSRGKDAIPTPLQPDRQSPVILMGDSHTLVFNAGGDLHAQGAGLADHLAQQFGFMVDLVGVRGAGTTVPRVDLARRKDNLKDKKLVIWCFSARQFTESVNGWMQKVPVIRKEN
jgi:alginate O-acetyltransferase complex protein AlgJ